MTDETISSILQRLNEDKIHDIIIGEIGESVWWGFVWPAIAQDCAMNFDIPLERDEFFFVKAADGQFAGAVYLLGEHDLKWFVAEPYRGKRLLVEPLKQIILPFIFDRNSGQYTQAGTLCVKSPYAKSSARLAEEVGFKKIGSSDGVDRYEIHKDSVAKFAPRKNLTSDIAALQLVIQQVDKNLRALYIALDELEVKYSNPSINPSAKLARDNLYLARDKIKLIVDNSSRSC